MTRRKIVRSLLLIVSVAAIAVGIWYLACPKPAPPGHPVPAITTPKPIAAGETGGESTGELAGSSGSSGDSTGAGSTTGGLGPVG